MQDITYAHMDIRTEHKHINCGVSHTAAIHFACNRGEQGEITCTHHIIISCGIAINVPVVVVMEEEGSEAEDSVAAVKVVAVAVDSVAVDLAAVDSAAVDLAAVDSVAAEEAEDSAAAAEAYS